MNVDARSLDEFLLGTPIPVDPGSIERTLSSLWKPDEEPGGVTRACLANLVFPFRSRGAIHAREAALETLARELPARRIFLLAAAGGGTPEGVSASVTAVCHRPSSSGPPVCCEEIRLACANAQLLPSTVRSLLVPDVPSVLCLLFDRIPEIELEMLSLADQVIADSRGQARLVALPSGRPEAVRVDDLAWIGLRPLREFLAEVFDAPLPLGVLDELVEIAIDIESRERSALAEGALLGAWIADRLGFDEVVERLPATDDAARTMRVRGPDTTRDLRVVLRPVATDASGREGRVRAIRLTERATSWVRIERLGSCWSACAHSEEACVLPRSAPVRELDDGALLGLALARPERRRDIAERARALAVRLLADE